MCLASVIQVVVQSKQKHSTPCSFLCRIKFHTSTFLRRIAFDWYLNTATRLMPSHSSIEDFMGNKEREPPPPHDKQSKENRMVKLLDLISLSAHVSFCAQPRYAKSCWRDIGWFCKFLMLSLQSELKGSLCHFPRSTFKKNLKIVCSV